MSNEIRDDGAGTLGSLAALQLGKKASSDYDERYSKLLGTCIYGKNGREFQLVRLNVAAGVTLHPRTFKLSANDGTFDVELAVDSDRCFGVSVEGQADLSDNDYFWIQKNGDYFDAMMGDGTAVAAGEFVELDNDADKGKVQKGASFDEAKTIGICIEASAGDGSVFKVRPTRRMNG